MQQQQQQRAVKHECCWVQAVAARRHAACWLHTAADQQPPLRPGTLPNSWGSLGSLVRLDLASTGWVPHSGGSSSWPAWDGMGNLQWLDLSDPTSTFPNITGAWCAMRMVCCWRRRVLSHSRLGLY